MLKKDMVRDGEGTVIGTVTSGFTGSYETVVREADGRLLGTTSSRFGTTRDSNGVLISNNTDDPGLLINRRK